MSRPRPNPWLVLVLVCIAQFMVVLDATIVNVALPSIQTDLGMSRRRPAVDRQRLHARVRRLPAARRTRRRPLGRKRVFLVGRRRLHASPRCSTGSRRARDVADRRPRRCRASAPRSISPAALSIITTTFEEGAERTKAMGVWAAIAVGGGAVGLVARRLPRRHALVAVDLLRQRPGRASRSSPSRSRYVPESRDEHAHRSFDVAGAVTVTAGLVALVYGIVKARPRRAGLGATCSACLGARGRPARARSS